MDPFIFPYESVYITFFAIMIMTYFGYIVYIGYKFWKKMKQDNESEAVTSRTIYRPSNSGPAIFFTDSSSANNQYDPVPKYDCPPAYESEPRQPPSYEFATANRNQLYSVIV